MLTKLGASNLDSYTQAMYLEDPRYVTKDKILELKYIVNENVREIAFKSFPTVGAFCLFSFN